MSQAPLSGFPQDPVDRQLFEQSDAPVATWVGNLNDRGHHRHRATEIALIVDGRAVHFTANGEYPVTAGDVLVIGHGMTHGYRQADGRIANVLYDPAVLGIHAHDLLSLPGYHAVFDLEPAFRDQHHFRSRLHLQPEGLEKARRLVARVDAELGARRPAYRTAALGLLLEYVVFLARSYSGQGSSHSQALLRLGEVLAFMHGHYAERITRPQLAAMAHMSESSLVRAFAKALGCSPIAYLIGVRVKKAAELLKAGAGNVTDVAYRVGFSDSNYFARQFRAHTGHAPSELLAPPGRKTTGPV